MNRFPCKKCVGRPNVGLKVGNRVQLRSIVGRLRPYIWIALGLFLVGMIIGGWDGRMLAGWLGPMENSLRSKAILMHRDSRPVMVFALFVNNLEVSLTMLAGGLLFAAVPVIGALANGALVGYVLAQLSRATGASPLLLFAAGVLPHGIFEIPAYILSSSVGLRLGWLMLRALAGYSTRSAWRCAARDIAPTVLWVMGLLFVAACIEANITPILLHAALRH